MITQYLSLTIITIHTQFLLYLFHSLLYSSILLLKCRPNFIHKHMFKHLFFQWLVDFSVSRIPSQREFYTLLVLFSLSMVIVLYCDAHIIDLIGIVIIIKATETFSAGCEYLSLLGFSSLLIQIHLLITMQPMNSI